MKKGLSPSQSFIDFSRGLISDFDLFENDGARIDLGLNCLMMDAENAVDSLQAFIDFVESLYRQRLPEAELEKMWRRSHAGFFIVGPGQIMQFLHFAAALAEKKKSELLGARSV